MNRGVRRALVGLCASFALVAAAVLAGAASGQAGTVTAGKALGAATIQCQGDVQVTVTLTGESSITGSPQDVMLVLDRSGSMAGTRLTDLKTAANGLIDRLDQTTDGVLDGVIANGSRVGVVSFAGGASLDAALTTSATTAKAAVNALAASGGTNHGDAINLAQAQFSGTNGRNMVIVTDGDTTSGPDPSAAAAAARGAAPPTEIFTIGIGVTDPSAAWTALKDWATDPDASHAFLTGGTGTLDAIFAEIGAAITGPAATGVSVAEMLGTDFAVVGTPVASKGTATVGGGGKTITWDGFDLGTETVTLQYTAKHDGNADPFGGVEVVSTSSASSSEGSITVANGAAEITVDPCEGELVVDQTCPAGTSCSAENIDIGGTTFAVDAGTAGAQTQLRVLSGVTVPAGVCSNAIPFGAWALIDIRPLSTGGIVISAYVEKETLKRARKHWFDVRGCWGTNETFPLERGGNATLQSDGAYWGTPKTFKNKRTCSVTTTIGGQTVPTVCSTVKNVKGGALLETFFPYIGNGKYDPKGGLY